MSQANVTCQVRALDHLVLTVASIPATVAFYTKVLGMESDVFTVADGTTRHALYFGHQKINLHEVDHEFDPKAAHPAPGTADLCFLTDQSTEDWIRHLAQHSVGIEEGPVQRTGAAGRIMSLYMRDSDQNLIEIGTLAEQAD